MDMNPETLKMFFNEKTDEEIKFLFFKAILEDYDNSKKMLDLLSNEIGGLGSIFYLAFIAKIMKEDFLEKKKYLEEVTDVSKNYKTLLQKCKLLADELNLNNSLEVANLYTYLLWNGYFSKDKELKFQIDNRVITHGAFSYDIANGIGVCLNFSNMLADFINEFDYSAASIINYMGKGIDKSYKVDIERNKSKQKLHKKLGNSIMSLISKKTGNHAFTLINEKGKLYIYDSTNLCAFKLINKNEAVMLAGKGNVKIKPYFSYSINFSEKTNDTLDKLHNSNKIESPYSKKDFIITWEESLELFLDNIKLLDDFYEDVKDKIIYISDTQNRSKQLIKEYNKNQKK